MDESERNKEIKIIQPSSYEAIDYSDEILHVRQTGMQCWSRSSQMMLSYILIRIGFTKEEIKQVFYENLFLDLDTDENINEKEYLDLNQRILGRRLRESEIPLKSLDALVVKIYAEFGSTSFLAEVFPSFIKQYLHAFTKVTKRFRHKIITLIMDNDNEKEVYRLPNSCTVIYKTFSSIFNNGLTTGLLKGDDREFWVSLTEHEKSRKLYDFLTISPILVESPGHAFVLSGYLPKEKQFIVNDSLASSTRVVREKNLIKSLSSIVLLVTIENK